MGLHHYAGLHLDAYRAAQELIGQHPKIAPESRETARHLNLRAFPYQIWYRVLDHAGVVEILAVVHNRRGPTALDERLGPG